MFLVENVTGFFFLITFLHGSSDVLCNNNPKSAMCVMNVVFCSFEVS